MRYVGRHRAPRPLMLRRPIVGGVAAAVLLCVPAAWAATLPNSAVHNPSKQASSDQSATDSPLPDLTTDGQTLVPTDNSVVPTDSSTTSPTATHRVTATAIRTTHPTVTHTTTAAKTTTSKPTTTTKKPTVKPTTPKPTTSPTPSTSPTPTPTATTPVNGNGSASATVSTANPGR